MTVSAQLDTIDLTGADAIEWSLTSGVRPFQTTLSVSVAAGDALLGKTGQELTLKVTEDVINGVNQTLEVQKVSVLHESGTSAPYLKKILISDLRWKWPYIHIFKRYNITRRSGNKRRVEHEGPLQVEPVVDDLIYAEWSLNPPEAGGKPWTALEVLENVLTMLVGEGAFTIRDEVKRRAQPHSDLPIQNFELDDPGDQALARALSQIPGARVYVDKQGQVIVYDHLSGKEEKIVNDAGPPVVGDGIPQKVDKDAIRPKSVHVVFSREQELRFDSLEDFENAVQSEKRRVMENVLPVPDVPHLPGDPTKVTGTWVTFNEAIAAWKGQPKPITNPPDLTLDIIRRNFFLPHLFSLYTAYGVNPDLNSQQPEAAWSRRIAMVRQHYRRTYRITKYWMNRIYSLRAHRVSLLDPETGTRAPAAVYSNYSVFPRIRGPLTGIGAANLGFNVEGYAAKLKDTFPAPANVNIIDTELGIIQVNYVLDPFGLYTQIWPSKIQNMPTANLGDDARPVGWGIGAVDDDQKMAELSKQHKVAIVLTAAPGAPNSKDQLHEEVYEPTELSGIIPGVGEEGGQGPILFVRIGSGMETARFAWDDDKEQEIGQSFGVDIDKKVDFEAGTPVAAQFDISELLVNESTIRELGKVAAARALARFIDKMEGSKRVKMNPMLEPEGTLDRVSHRITTNGETFSDISVPSTPDTLSLDSLLPAHIRRKIQRLIQPDGGK